MIGANMKLAWPALLAFVLAGAASAGGQEADMSYGVPVYPDAEPMPEVARAVEAYYRPGVPHDRRIETEAFVTPAAFEEVYRFYGPRMEPGKWGWRRKSYALEHQTQTLRFMRANLDDDGSDGGAPIDALEPLFGEAGLTATEFEARLAALNEKYPDAEIEIAEGSRQLDGEVAATVRITIERPYLDLNRLQLVDRTRIVMVKVSGRDGR